MNHELIAAMHQQTATAAHTATDILPIIIVIAFVAIASIGSYLLNR
jgi:hypothetical protein